MCAVTTDGMFLINLVGDTVHERLLGHGLMECGIKYKNLRGVGHNLKATLNALNMCTGVQGSQIAAKLKLFHNILGQQHGFREECATVDDSVTDSLDLVHALDTAVIGIKKSLYNTLHGNRVVGDGNRCLVNLVGQKLLVSQLAVNADAVAKTLGDYGIAGGIEQLILQRAGAGVYNKYVHENKTSKSMIEKCYIHYIISQLFDNFKRIC